MIDKFLFEFSHLKVTKLFSTSWICYVVCTYRFNFDTAYFRISCLFSYSLSVPWLLTLCHVLCFEENWFSVLLINFVLNWPCNDVTNFSVFTFFGSMRQTINKRVSVLVINSQSYCTYLFLIRLESTPKSFWSRI